MKPTKPIASSYLKCSLASENWSWPNCIKPTCWRILLCKICGYRKSVRSHWTSTSSQIRKRTKKKNLLSWLSIWFEIKKQTLLFTWNLSLGIFLCAPSVSVSASSTLWPASKSWICVSSGRGTRTYTALVEASIILPDKHTKTRSKYQQWCHIIHTISVFEHLADFTHKRHLNSRHISQKWETKGCNISKD